MTFEELMQMQGDESTLKSEVMSSASYKQQAQSLYNELDAINQQYGQDSILPDRVVDRIHNIYTMLNHTMNEWEQHKSRARSETRGVEGAKFQQRTSDAFRTQLGSGRPAAPGQHNVPIEDRLEQVAAGQYAMPGPKKAFTNVPPAVPQGGPPSGGVPKRTPSGMPPGGGPRPQAGPPASPAPQMYGDEGDAALQGRRLGIKVPRYQAMFGQQ